MRSQFQVVSVLCALWALPLAAAVPAAPPAPDAFVTVRAKVALWTTAGVRSSSVHVDTTEGRLTLYGKVPTAAQRALAEKTAAAVPGVTSVKNLLQVVAQKDEKTTVASDRDLKVAVEKAMATDPLLTGTNLSVKSVDKGVVLLVGQARSYTEHLRALICVDRVPGVARVSSDVKPPRDFLADERLAFRDARTAGDTQAALIKNDAHDLRITTEVKLRLLTAAQVPSADISVDTDDGVVTLFGIVPTADVKNAAGAEANLVGGVRQVDNQLEVVATAARQAVEAKDADVSRDLALAFQGRPAVSHVEAHVRNGTVQLQGTVPSGWDLLHALRLARGVSGVTGLENQLKLAGTP